MALADVNDGGTPYMGISPGGRRPCTHRPEQEPERINPLHPAALLNGTRSGRMSLKKCVFGCEGKITLLSFPKNPVLREQWIRFVHRLILKDGAVPAIKDLGHGSELQTVSERHQMYVFCW